MPDNTVSITNSGGGNIDISNSAVGQGNVVYNVGERPATHQASTLISRGVPRNVVEQLIEIHRRSLEKLYIQEAQLGTTCPPHIKLEIEDREAAIEMLQKAS